MQTFQHNTESFFYSDRKKNIYRKSKPPNTVIGCYADYINTHTYKHTQTSIDANTHIDASTFAVQFWTCPTLLACMHMYFVRNATGCQHCKSCNFNIGFLPAKICQQREVLASKPAKKERANFYGVGLGGGGG